ncbi:hypothetical protein AAGF08_13635 [Algoriphagus sp. SE2]|uniref:hypothetical protein n=1 Tax=Algoriphagus sp. SE2 TaxID=3141536 RepID=UPI0031CD532D
MKKISLFTSSIILGALTISACSTNRLATTGEQDNLYFMASDARIATEFAVQNNNPESFESLGSLNTESYKGENFSSRNVNPEYIARYTAVEDTTTNGMVYFDEGIETSGEGDINAYDNYRVDNSNSSFGSGFTPSMTFNIGYMGGFSPWGMGFYNPFYDPFFMPGMMYPSFGFRPGFSLGIGIGFGFGSFWGPSYAWGGYPGFGYPGFGYPGYGYPGYGFNRPIYVLPGGEYGDRRVVRGARASRGGGLASASSSTRSSAILPSTSRAQARREAINSPSNRSLVSNTNSRSASRQFGNSQNDYYTNSRSRVGTTRNVSSPAITRSATRSRSAMPSARPSNSRSSNSYYSPSRNSSSYDRRSSSPSYNRSSSPSYNRSNIPSRTRPSYGTPSRMSTPSRGSTNTRTFSTPSRSSGSSGISTGGSRSSGGGSVSRGSSRGGRGN